jgi:hypothetical protein
LYLYCVFPGSVLGILLVLGYLRPEDYSSSRSKDVVLTDESGNFHLDNSTHPNITNTALVDNPPEIVNATVELANNATAPEPELEKASSSSWTFTYPNLGPSLGVVVDRTESDDFKKWAAAFFPHATPPLSSRDIFLQKIIGTGPYPVCRQESDPLDFSAGTLHPPVISKCCIGLFGLQNCMKKNFSSMQVGWRGPLPTCTIPISHESTASRTRIRTSQSSV